MRGGPLAAALLLLLGATGGRVDATDEPEAAHEPLVAWDVGRSRLRLDVGWPEGITYEIGRRQELHEGWEEILRPFEDVMLSGRVTARLDVDAAGFVANPRLGDFQNGVEVRRARFSTAGRFRLGFETQYLFEFAIEGSQIFLNQFAFTWSIPRWVDWVTLGNTTPPMGLENLESSRAISFMEAGSPILALAPGYRPGLLLGGYAPAWRLAWSAGLFTLGQTQSTGDASRSAAQAIARLALHAGAPDGPGNLVHLGLSASSLFSGDSRIQYRAQPESFIAPVVVDTDAIEAANATQYGVELAWVHGPRTVQAELLQSFVQGITSRGEDVRSFWGAYLFASWILTGERRPYDPTQGIFTRIVPHRAFHFREPGWGALALDQRVSWLDLTDGQLRGGRMLSATTGLSWYLNAYLRLMFNYVFARVTDRPGDGNANVFESRVEFGF